MSVNTLFIDSDQFYLEKDVTQILKIFATLNPMFNFGHKGYRLSAEKLIKKLGFGKVQKASLYAVSIQTQKFAPIITNPTQLLNKYAELQVYYAKHELKKGMTVKKL